jgi:adenosylcobinamide-phosphate synthase
MSFFAALIALLLDQVRPASHAKWAEHAAQWWVKSCLHWGDTGRTEHTRLLSLLIILLPALAAWGLEYGLAHLNVALGWLWSIFVLYVCMGFRQFSSGFGAVRAALEGKDVDAARAAFQAWTGKTAATMDMSELAQASASHGVAQTHVQVLAPLFAFALLPSVCGPLLYRIAELCATANTARLNASPAFMASSRRLFGWVNFIPARLSAAGFAIVGHFEEAANAWREAAGAAREHPMQWLIRVAYGALAVRTELRATDEKAEDNPSYSSDKTLDDPYFNIIAPDFLTAHLSQVVGLLWRSVVMWMGLLALLQFTAIVA